MSRTKKQKADAVQKENERATVQREHDAYHRLIDNGRAQCKRMILRNKSHVKKSKVKVDREELY